MTHKCYGVLRFKSDSQEEEEEEEAGSYEEGDDVKNPEEVNWRGVGS